MAEFVKKFCNLVFIVHTVVWFLTPYSSRANEDTFAVYSEKLMRHLVSAMRNMRAESTQSISICENCSKTIQDRHLFQRAMDIEHHLNALKKMMGQQIAAPEIIEIKPYGANDTNKIIMRIHDNFKNFAELSQIINQAQFSEDHTDLRSTNNDMRNPYNTLDRIEILLMELGSPSVQPNLVLRRARMISSLVKELCTSQDCASVNPRSPEPFDFKRPINAFNEAQHLIILLDKFARQNSLNISGGVTVIPPSSAIITPRQVNRLYGVLLADLIALNYEKFGPGTIPVEKIVVSASPTQVWQQINYAKRLLESAL
jgi:hypothetical protein